VSNSKSHQFLFKIVGFDKNGTKLFSTNFVNNDSVTFSVGPYYLNLVVNYVDMAKIQFEDLQSLEDLKQIANNNLSILDESKHSDFTYFVADQQFKVHKNILSVASPVFERTFISEMTEAKTNEARIETYTPEVFEHLLRFIYAGKLPENLTEISEELYKAAHFYQIELLKKICKQNIYDNLSMKNAVKFHEFAHVYEMEDMKQSAWKIIKK
jgi:hypothetical protein